mmetsp:Transcript_14273/g.36836  ORF Transcript_14273/g.36836 Transcript_14273/m.36836 type:complete len:175 (-) Transcript_14273:106-630(-)
MASYAEAKTKCRKQLIAERFGETVTREECSGTCDVCSRSAESAPVAVNVADSVAGVIGMLKHIAAMGERRTLTAAAELWRGTGRKHLKMDEVAKAPKGWTREECEHLFVQLVCDHIVAFEYANTAYATNSYVVLGPGHRRCLHDGFTYRFYRSQSVTAGTGSVRPSKKHRVGPT